MVRRLKLLAPLSLIGVIWATSPAPTQPPAKAPPPAAPSFEISGLRLAQPPSDRGGNEGRGGDGGERRMRFGGDPSQMFDRLSGGKDVISRDSLDDRQKILFDMFAKQMNVTNGQITRAQFTQGAEQLRATMGGGGMGGFGGRGPGGGGPGGGGGGFGSSMTPQQQDEFAVERFRRSDRNGDGFMDQSEMSERLKPNFQQYDTNKDGMLDLNEYKGYMKSFFSQQSTETAAATAISLSPDGKMAISLTPGAAATTPEAAKQQEEDARAVVFRTGKLPKDIPSWFEQIDTDKDGQIGLYEWVKASRTIDDFRSMDRNDDNFVTIDELMAYVRNGNKSMASGGTAVASTPSSGDPRLFGMPAAGGERGGFRFGRGNDNGGGERGGPPRWGKGGDNNNGGGGERGGPPMRWGKGDNNGGGFPRFGKGNDNGGERNGGFRNFGKGGERGERGNDRGNDNSKNNAPAPGAGTQPAATPGTPPADPRRPEGRGNRREEKGRGRP